MISEMLPRRLILTDDPLRAKMLSAHHLEYSTLLYEQGDVLVYSGSYKDVPIVLASTGIGSDAVLSYFEEYKGLGAAEIAYVGACVSTSDKSAADGGELRSVVLAAGGSRRLLDRALRTAKQYGIGATIRKVLPPDSLQPEGGCIVDDVTGALYDQTRADGIKALSVLTVSENTKTGEKIEEHEKRSRFYAAARLVFEMHALN